MSLLKTCRDVIPLLTELEEGTLSWFGALRLRMHLMICPECRQVLQDIQTVPEVVAAGTRSQDPELQSIGRLALRGALARLDESKPRPAAGPVPEDVRRLLARDWDPTLRIVEEVHEAFASGLAPQAAPYLPASVLSRLPNPEQWNWTRKGTARAVTLMEGPAGSPRLSLLVAPRGFRAPAHTHEGTESMFILDGVMEDGEKVYTTGHWIHFGKGSSHAPVILNDECWCLIREEGTVRVHGPFGWFQRLFVV